MIIATVSPDEPSGGFKVTIGGRGVTLAPDQPILVSVLDRTGLDDEVRQYWNIAGKATDYERIGAVSGFPIVLNW